MSQPRAKVTYPLWKTNIVKSGGITAAMAAAMLAAGNSALSDFIVGIPPFMFMVYIILASLSSRRARKAEEKGEIDEAINLTAQSRIVISRMAATGGSTRDLRARVAFDLLLSNVRLLRSKYGRYLDKNAVLASQEAERMIIDASLPEEEGAGNTGRLVALLEEQVGAIRGGVLDVDDPRLRAMREAL